LTLINPPRQWRQCQSSRWRLTRAGRANWQRRGQRIFGQAVIDRPPYRQPLGDTEQGHGAQLERARVVDARSPDCCPFSAPQHHSIIASRKPVPAPVNGNRSAAANRDATEPVASRVQNDQVGEVRKGRRGTEALAESGG